MNNVKCPSCDSKYVIKKGSRKGSFDNAQVYHCKSCGKVFTDKLFKYSMYPAEASDPNFGEVTPLLIINEELMDTKPIHW